MTRLRESYDFDIRRLELCQAYAKVHTMPPTRKSTEILGFLAKQGSRMTVYHVRTRQVEIAKQLAITRQALAVHLKRLRDFGYIQTGRGFLNVSESGGKAVGMKTAAVIIGVKVSPQHITEVSRSLRELPAQEIFRVTGDLDIILHSEQEKLDEMLAQLSKIDGVLETRTYLCIDTIR